jgi:hypothetical protein
MCVCVFRGYELWWIALPPALPSLPSALQKANTEVLCVRVSAVCETHMRLSCRVLYWVSSGSCYGSARVHAMGQLGYMIWVTFCIAHSCTIGRSKNIGSEQAFSHFQMCGFSYFLTGGPHHFLTLEGFKSKFTNAQAAASMPVGQEGDSKSKGAAQASKG